MRRLFLFLVLILFGSLFAGEAFAPWADGTSPFKIPITLQTSSIITGNVTDDHVILVDFNVEQTNFWANVEATGADVKFFNNAETAEYDFYFQEFNNTTDKMLAWVKVTDTFESTADQNIYLYYGSGETNPFQSKINTLSDALAIYHFDEGVGTTTFDEKDTNNMTLSNANIWLGTGFLGDDGLYTNDLYQAFQNLNGGTLLDQYPADITISFWYKPDVDDDETQAFFFQKNSASIVESELRNDGEIRTDVVGQYTIDTTNGVYNIGEWYKITWVGGSAGAAIYTNASVGETSASTALPGFGNTTDFYFGGNTGAAFFVDGELDELRIMPTHFSEDEVKLAYASDTNSLTRYFATEANPVDLNITGINGVSFLTNPSFSFGIDGNISIDFNVFEKGNRRLSIDFNYFISILHGTGTVIIKDLNLTSDICPDQEWDDVPSECSFKNFNYIDVEDGNYTILGSLSSSSGLDFNTGDGNFEVLNDVNLLILVPLDEETFEVLDTNIYSFRVSYSDGNNFFTFSDLITPIHLSVPIGTNFLTFTIDENTSDYFPRHYFLNFPIPINSATLQPYLVKKETAGGTGIQSVLFTRTENNKAVPSIEIRAFRAVPNTGKTLMEQLVTDAAGSATFSFVQNETYTLDFLRDGNIFSSDLILNPVFSAYQFYLSAEVFNVPDENALIFDVNYSPSLDYIDSNTWADINLSIVVQNTTISDLNILIYLDDNTLFNVIVFVDGFYALPPVSIVGATKILNVEVILTTADGLRLSRSKAYSYNLSVQQKGLNEFFEDLPGLVNFTRNSIHLEISTLGFLILTIFICGAIKSKSQIDTGGLALFGLLLMGIFTYMGFVYLPAFLVAVIIAFALVIFTRAF